MPIKKEARCQKTKCQSRHLKKSTPFTSPRTTFTHFFSFLVSRSPGALKQAPTIPCIAGSVCTAPTVSPTRQALTLKEVKLVMARPDAVGCKVGCRNLRSDMW